MSIAETKEKVKGFFMTERGRGVYLAVIIVLIALTSFGLGRLSQTKVQNQPQVVIQGNVLEISKENTGLSSNTTQNSTSQVSREKGSYTASKRGKKYYPVDCSAAKNLKPENLIYFQTATAAEAAGYTPSSSCQ